MIDREVLTEYVKKHYTYNPESGRVRRKGKDCDVAGYKCGNGYLYIDIRMNGQREGVLVHKLVWTLCHGRFPTQIDHIDGNPRNNRVENLREVSRIENLENRLMPWKPNVKTDLPGVFYEQKNNRYRIKLNRLYAFRDKYVAFVTMTLLGRMFRVPNE